MLKHEAHEYAKAYTARHLDYTVYITNEDGYYSAWSEGDYDAGLVDEGTIVAIYANGELVIGRLDSGDTIDG